MADLAPSKLNRLPEGLLSFFDIKSMGQYPQLLSEELKPTIDLTRFYADQASEEAVCSITPFLAASTASASTNIATSAWNAGGLAQLADPVTGITTVPANEIWMVLEAVMRWEFTATAGIETQVVFMNSNLQSTANAGSVITDSNQGFTLSSATIARAGQCVMTKGPFFMLSQSQLRIFQYGSIVPAGQIDIRGYIRLRRLRR